MEEELEGREGGRKEGRKKGRKKEFGCYWSWEVPGK